MSIPIWCEFCRDHYDQDHFDSEGDHLAGAEYGPTGEAMAREAALEEIVRAFAGADPCAHAAAFTSEGYHVECLFCEAGSAEGIASVVHAADCLWRRAAEWVEASDA